MSSDLLQLHLDFERTHEFRLLVNELKTRAAADKQHSEKSFEALAVFVFLRLFVELAFLARTTNRPGYLTESGKILFEGSLQPLFGDDEADAPVEILKRAKVLEMPQAGEAGECYCEVFARLNGHLAGNYQTKEQRGNKASLYERQKNKTLHDAQQQSLLLQGRDIFRKREGSQMSTSEIQRAMVLIKTLDNALGTSSRTTNQYTESLMADAFEVSAKYAREPDVLKNVYVYIINNRTDVELPKTTEQILANFERVEKLSRQ